MASIDRRILKYKIPIIILCVLIAIRLVLPTVVLHYSNKTLANMDGYYGHIKDIDISIYRGAYQLNDIYIDKIDTANSEHVKFFNSKVVDLSIEWKALFHGSIVGELVFDFPAVYFTKDKVELSQVQKDTNDFRKLLDDFMPLRVNRFEINNGRIHYIDNTATPKIDIRLDDAYILAENLSTIEDRKIELPSTVFANAEIYNGNLNLNMKLNALAIHPTFDLNAELNNTNLVLMNDFLKAYGNFDINKGTFGLYTEMAADNGNFKGYVKPLITDLDVVGPEDNNDSFFHKIWESAVSTAGFIFKNQPKDQLATKVPMQGSFKNPDSDIWTAVFEVLKNAFIHALLPSIDNQISIKSVKGNSSKDNHQSVLQNIYSDNKSIKTIDTKK